MALHPKFPTSPYSILDPEIRWFPADETLRETTADKLMPPLVPSPPPEFQAVSDSKAPLEPVDRVVPPTTVI